MHVLLTRPALESEELARLLEARGYSCWCEPMLVIEDCPWDPRSLDGARAVLLTSRNGARALARAKGVSRDLRVIAVGPATAAEARSAGFQRIEAANGTAEDMLRYIRAGLDPHGGRLVHLSGATVSCDLAAELSASGYSAERVVGYQARHPERLSRELGTWLATGQIQAGLFFSEQTAQVFCRLALKQGIDRHCGSVAAVGMSDKIVAALQPVAWRRTVSASNPSLAAMIAALREVAADGAR